MIAYNKDFYNPERNNTNSINNNITNLINDRRINNKIKSCRNKNNLEDNLIPDYDLPTDKPTDEISNKFDNYYDDGSENWKDRLLSLSVWGTITTFYLCFYLGIAYVFGQKTLEYIFK
ncbi:MAG: hypothetical protein QXW97_01150 [Candidatus Pacearchaeota archaeon]